MRIWHYRLLPYLPDSQFKGQLRELTAIMRDWRDKGTTNHLLINRVMDFPKWELVDYFAAYCAEYKHRYGQPVNVAIIIEFSKFSMGMHYPYVSPYRDWHNDRYLRVCMANLYEKHEFGVGKSRISEDEWQRLLDGYRLITGEDYQI